MQTLDLDGAASLLFASPGQILKLVYEGEIPASKVGRRWVFIDVDLIAWLRAKSASNESEVQQCRSIRAPIVRNTGANSLSTDAKYAAALALPNRTKQKNLKQSSAQVYTIK